MKIANETRTLFPHQIEGIEFLKKKKLIIKGDVIINTAAIPMEIKGKTNMLKITVID